MGHGCLIICNVGYDLGAIVIRDMAPGGIHVCVDRVFELLCSRYMIFLPICGGYGMFHP